MYSKVEQLHSRANSFATKFKEGGGSHHIDEAIGIDREALTLCPPGCPMRLSTLNQLSAHLLDRYSRLGVLKDADEAISISRDALALCSPGHPDRSTFLNNLSIYLSVRYEQLGGMEDLNEAIVLARDALALCTLGHPHRPETLHSFIRCLSIRYQQLGGMEDLDQAIILGKDAMVLCPPGHPLRSTSLINVALYLSYRYQRFGGMEDLDEAIVLGRDALALCPSGHPQRSTSLINVALYLSSRYQRLGGIEDLDEAIVLGRDALVLCPPGHPLRSMTLRNIGCYLSCRYKQLGGAEDLDEAIVSSRDALALCPPGHPLRSGSLNNVADHLFSRYLRVGGVEDHNEAIILSKDALALHPPGHPDRSMALSNIANYLSSRCTRLGKVEDLDEAIVLSRDALVLRPPGHSNRSASLNNVAVHLLSRYRQLGGVEDLNEAIALSRDALVLCPPGHLLRSMCLNNVADYLSSRHQRLGGVQDLDEAIIFSRDALALHPPGHPDRSASLNNVAIYLSSRYQRLRRREDLDEAIVHSRDALVLCPPGHPDRSKYLSNVAIYLFSRYQQVRGIDDLNESISLARDALSLLPPGHADSSQSLENLTHYLRTRYAQSSQLRDKEELFNLYTQLSHILRFPSSADLSATRAWIRAADDFQHPTTILAYETSLRLLVHHSIVLPPLPQHLDVLKGVTSSLAVDAFSACVRSRSPTKAIELLEQGRAVFWSQLTRLKAPLDDVVALGSAGTTLAEKFTELTLLIRNAIDSPGADQHNRMCHLNIEFQRAVTAIRKLSGLSRFLLPSPFPDLQQAASRGPIVIVNASTYSCDALIVLLDQDPVHIPLQITRVDIQRLSSELYTWTARAKLMDVSKYLVVILRELWNKVVSPIVDILQTVHLPQSRIWWCPTAEFSLLPLHAAGPYRRGQRRFADLYVSSYTSTLTALIRAKRTEPSNSASQVQHFVGIGQAKAMGESELHSVGAELANIGQRVDGLARFTRIEGPDSCIQRVVEELNENQWAHLACHGIPNQQQPFKSAFALSDGHFTIERIMQCHLPDAQFAYLSACHTTVGDEKSPDEMIHLAAAMQFAGFRSVIGTMWAVDDEQAEKITSVFYDNMVDGSGRLDHTRAAFALHKTMRELDGISFDQRILYIHLGA